MASRPGVLFDGVCSADDVCAILVGVGVKVLVGSGGRVAVSVAVGVFGMNGAGKMTSAVGVEYVPHSEEDCPQEVSIMDAIMRKGKSRFTGDPLRELYLY